MATEATALGAHSDLWRPREGRLSSLVEQRGAGRVSSRRGAGLGRVSGR